MTGLRTSPAEDLSSGRSAPELEVLSVRTTAADTVDVHATVIGGRRLDRPTVDRFSRKLTEAAGQPVRLTLRILTARSGVSGVRLSRVAQPEARRFGPHTVAAILCPQRRDGSQHGTH